mmetsp:Transcript_115616/g.332011  ORF Transcript_115616/g.332011 Transcript_115616/m.332011 type:complete len:202 (+) Transcript_115616:1026-1631(+)
MRGCKRTRPAVARRVPPCQRRHAPLRRIVRAAARLRSPTSLAKSSAVHRSIAARARAAGRPARLPAKSGRRLTQVASGLCRAEGSGGLGRSAVRVLLAGRGPGERRLRGNAGSGKRGETSGLRRHACGRQRAQGEQLATQAHEEQGKRRRPGESHHAQLAGDQEALTSQGRAPSPASPTGPAACPCPRARPGESPMQKALP